MRLIDEIQCGNIICGVAKDKADIEAAEKLRYEMLLMDFNSENTNANATDKSEYDDICEHLVAIDTDTNKVVGTYRVLASNKLPKGAMWITEHEFDITNLKNCGEGIVELSRAVVHADYRNGSVIKMLWKALFVYALKYNIRYLFGTASYHGIDKGKYTNSFAWLNDKYLVDDVLSCTPIEHAVEFGTSYDLEKAKEETPSLIKGYLAMGSKVTKGGYIDYEFGSIDVLTILDLKNVSRVFERIIK
ncbi:MAG: GNAT family N-acetyltransferase [Clostridia bacterium]|nr:GNAT family N-acetyltransferase [Clostridia bacterium]